MSDNTDYTTSSPVTYKPEAHTNPKTIPSFHFIYERGPRDEITIRMAKPKEEFNDMGVTVCQAPKTNAHTTAYSFAQMASIMCERDVPSLESTSATVLEELQMLLNLKRNTIHTHLRKKRALGMIAGGLAVAGASANIFSSSATDKAPLSWAGSILGNLFGWLSKDDLDIPIRKIIANTNTIEAIKVN